MSVKVPQLSDAIVAGGTLAIGNIVENPENYKVSAAIGDQTMVGTTKNLTIPLPQKNTLEMKTAGLTRHTFNGEYAPVELTLNAAELSKGALNSLNAYNPLYQAIIFKGNVTRNGIQNDPIFCIYRGIVNPQDLEIPEEGAVDHSINIKINSFYYDIKNGETIIVYDAEKLVYTINNVNQLQATVDNILF